MKKIVIGLFLLTLTLSFTFAGGFQQVGVAPPPGDMFGGVNDAGRGVLAGTDLDQDGKKEVWITSYLPANGMVYCFEEAGTDTLALIWHSDTLPTCDYQYPRDVKTGDLDNDGFGEIIFHVGRHNGVDKPDNGIHVYEWDGVTDNGFGHNDNDGNGIMDADFRVNFYSALNDSLTESRVESFSVGDIDGDGQDEILLANNGKDDTDPLGTKNGDPSYPGDRFIIMSVTGNFPGFTASIVEEYSVSPRDVDKDGTRENALGGGSPQDIIICDTDGDGMLEAACFSYQYLNLFFIEATGPDTYTLGDTTFVWLSFQDAWTLGASAADMDGNGKDEVYVVGYDEKTLFVITDMDGDATSIDIDTETGVVGGKNVGEPNLESQPIAVKDFGVVLGGRTQVSDLTKYTLTPGADPLQTASWTKTIHAFSNASTSTDGWAFKVSDAQDWDNDGNWEFVLPYQGLNDDDPNLNRVFRIAEWGDDLAVNDITVIMPDDYRLEQNYPNPFNPMTTISYTLPLQNNITVNIYNFLGEHVVTLVNGEIQQAGVHNVVWNSLDKNGTRVPSGTYFYEMKYGNFSQTKRMTLLK